MKKKRVNELLPDPSQQKKIVVKRLVIGFLGVVISFLILIFRFYQLQIEQHEKFQTIADGNRLQLQPTVPARGLIFDRNGRILAENVPSFRIVISEPHLSKAEELIREISSLVNISESDVDSFFKRASRAPRGFSGVTLRENLTEVEIANFSVNQHRLKGATIQAGLVRHYPYGEIFAHVLGYVGPVGQSDLNKLSEDRQRLYEGVNVIGKTGVESYYENELLGAPGYSTTEVDANGRFVRTVEEVLPKNGMNLTLSIDADLQLAAFNALKGTRGAIVAMEPHTGSVLAMVSTPSFDPHLFSAGINKSDYDRILKSEDHPLINRAIQGYYSPGSILKPIMGIGALDKNIININHTIDDPGFFELGNRKYRDWKKFGHGQSVDLHHAIAESCNTFFYDLAVRMGIERIHGIGQKFGLGQMTGIDLPNEKDGIWPSAQWKTLYRKSAWRTGDSLNTIIGQGFVSTTPVQLASMVSTIANKGERYRPHVVSKVGDKSVQSVAEVSAVIEPSIYDHVITAMEAVLHSTYGTARVAARNSEIKMAGKSGTSQLISIAQNEQYNRNRVDERHRDQALFVLFAPTENPMIALSVTIENAESGSSAAAPIAVDLANQWVYLNSSKLD